MKVIFQKPIYEKEYYVNSNASSFEKKIYPEHKLKEDEPGVFLRLNVKEYITFFEEEDCQEEFRERERVCINDKIVYVEDIIRGINKRLYRISEYYNNKDILEDKDSKAKIMEEYELALEKYNNGAVKKIMLKKITDKKWWQFWK